MKRMTHLALSLLLVVSASGIAVSHAEDAATQGPRDKKEWKAKHEEARQRFEQELNLTAEQKAKIKSIRQAFRESHKAEFDAMKAKHQEMKQLKQSGADEKALAAKRQEMKSQFAGLKQDKQKMMAEIKAVLTPEQAAKLEAMKKQHKGKRHHRSNQQG